MPPKVLVIGSYDIIHTARPEGEISIGLAKAGFDMTVMTHGDTQYAIRFAEQGVRVIPFYPQHKFKQAESRLIRKELIDGRYDILQLYTSKAIVNGIRAARGLPVKVVLYRGYAGHINWYDPAAYLKYLHPRVDAIICNSIGVEEYLGRQITLDRRKLITINKGHDLRWYKDITPIDPMELGIPEDAFIITCMANVRPMKGIPYLLEAMRWIPRDIPAHLVIGGRDTHTPQLMKIVRSLPDPSRVHLPGYRDDALNIVAASDVFALASVKGESITRAVLEAMALGIAPVITAIRGNAELVEDGISGLIVPPGNAKALAEAIVRLYQDPLLRKNIGAAARERIATRLSHERTVAEMRRFYGRIVNKNKN